jgi:tRNA dimethylallyltransferase
VNRPPLVAVVGPTATGKSELGVELALQLGGEVVNADAMQLYRGMDIGTAKLTVPERRGVPHHLLDVLDVTEPASVAAFQRDARAHVERIAEAGRIPVLVGGSGLYLQAVLDDLRFPGTDPAVRARLEAELAEVGSAALHRRLAGLDPAAARDVLPSNGRRIVRALEVVEITGARFTARLARPPLPRTDAVVLGLDLASDVLDARIERRVHRMFAAGLVDEVQNLVKLGLREGRTASRALGYRQVLTALDSVRLDRADEMEAMAAAEPETVRATRRFVRRQRSWFRRDPSIRWLDASAENLSDLAIRRYRSGP